MSATPAARGEDPAVRRGRHVPAGQGPTVWLNGDAYTIKVDETASGGGFALLEASVPPGGGPPPHTHRHEDEAFYLLDGALEVLIGDRTVTARAGDFVFIPRDTPHGFRNSGVHTARQLLIFAPGGFERFFLEAGRPAVAGEPIPRHDPADDDRVRQVAERLGSFQLIPAAADTP